MDAPLVSLSASADADVLVSSCGRSDDGLPPPHPLKAVRSAITRTDRWRRASTGGHYRSALRCMTEAGGRAGAAQAEVASGRVDEQRILGPNAVGGDALVVAQRLFDDRVGDLHGCPRGVDVLTGVS